MKLTKIFFALSFMSVSNVLTAQQVEMADTLRSEGKIYVVVAIILVIFIGLVIYLFSIDRRVSRLEKKVIEKKRDS